MGDGDVPVLKAHLCLHPFELGMLIGMLIKERELRKRDKFDPLTPLLHKLTEAARPFRQGETKEAG